MSASEVQRLRAAAERAFEAGRHQEALAHSIRLERAEPDEPAWARYTAIVCKAMGRTADQIDAMERAADRHAARGEVMKAAAVCKHILELDPHHEPTRARLRRLRAIRARERTPARPVELVQPGEPIELVQPVRPVEQVEQVRPVEQVRQVRQVRPVEPVEPVRPVPAVHLPPGAWNRDGGQGLSGLPLRDVVPGARRLDEPRNARGVYAIPLTDVSEDALTLALEEAVDAELATGAKTPQVMRPAPTSAPPPGLSAEDAAVHQVAEALRAAQRTEQALTDTPLFREMPEAAFHALIDRAKLVRLDAGQDVFRQGAPGDALYVVAEGEVGVIDEGPPRKGLRKLGEGDFFGEMALVSDAPRSATCTALTRVELICIDRETMQEVLRNHSDVLTVVLRFFRDRSIDRFLGTSRMFAGLTARDREIIRPHFRFLEVERGAVLVAEGMPAGGLIVLLAGRAEVVRDGDPVRLGLLFPGDIAGERSVLRDEPAKATVRALDKVFAIELPASAFKKIVEARPSVRALVEQGRRRRERH